MSASKDTLAFFYEYGCRIWERMRFARERNQRISETTITENLIFDFWYQAKNDHLPIEVYEATAENRNGNDLEVFVETKKGYLLIALQAKILSKKGKYPNISHKAGDTYQIDLLINYAKSRGGQACYLFYNYAEPEEYYSQLEASGKYLYRQFGLTACNAESVKLKFFKKTTAGKTRIAIPTFEDLHPLHAFPFSELLRILTDRSAMKIFEELGEMVNLPVIYYSREHIETEHGWNSLTPTAKISGLPEKEFTLIAKEHEPIGFQPKYRIVLSGEQKSPRLYALS